MTDLTETTTTVEAILAAAREELADVAERRAVLAAREACLRRAVAAFEEGLALLRDDPAPEAPAAELTPAALRCPIGGCAPRPRNRQSLVIHLTNGHREGKRYLARPYRSELVAYAERIAAGEPLSQVVIESLIGPAPGTIPLAIRELTEEEKADNTTDDHCTGCEEFLSECTCDDPADPAVVPLFGCPARRDDSKGMCTVNVPDPDELYEHLETHAAWSGLGAEEIEARCEAVRDAQRAAGLPATYGMEPVQ